MASNLGAKVSKSGVSVFTGLNDLTKMLFQLISTDGCLLRKEKSSSPSSTNAFLGYTLVTSRYMFVSGSGWQWVSVNESRPINYPLDPFMEVGQKVYIIYENPL